MPGAQRDGWLCAVHATATLLKWLTKLRLNPLKSKLKGLSIESLADLVKLTEDDLCSFGLKSDQQKRLRHALFRLGNKNVTDVHSAQRQLVPSFLSEKYVDLPTAFRTSLFLEFKTTRYYKVLYGTTKPHATQYQSVGLSERRRMLHKSLATAKIKPTTLCCTRSCSRPLAEGVSCDGEHSLSGQGGVRIANKVLQPSFSECDPDNIAVHLWTFSMSQNPAFYCRLNNAVLTDSMKELSALAYIICALNRWISQHPGNEGDFGGRDHVMLYRGTPIQEAQKHQKGNPLPRQAGKEVSEEVHQESGLIARMPMYVAASESKAKAQVSWIQVF
jgi:hypothetical protein